MIRISIGCSLIFGLLLGCADDKVGDKGQIDDSPPPESPVASAQGKADDASQVVPVDVQSQHPYGNDLNEEFVIELGDAVPSCTSRVRLHFAALQLESGYDFIRIVDAFGNIVESGTGNHDDEYSEWLELGSDSHRSVSVVLESDYSVVRHGFHIDGVEWQGAPICPAFVPTCPANEVDINPAPGACECPSVPTCTSIDEAEGSHSVGGGFAGTHTGTRFEGTTAIAFTQSVTMPSSETVLGTIDDDALSAFVRYAASKGVLHGPSVNEPSNWSESFDLSAGGVETSYTRDAGSYPQTEAEVIARFDALFVCGAGEPLECAEGMVCANGTCAEEAACICPEIYSPVCGSNGITYENECTAGCTGATVKHEGKCGIAGDSCGGFMGLTCLPDHKCRFGEGQYSYPFPDAGGTCVSESYCDAPADCSGLIHIAVPGTWACVANECSWDQGSPWLAMSGWSMETAHPYDNDVSQWQQLYAPEGARSVRIEIDGTFILEDGYDVLDVWSWNGSSWFKAARFTGTEADGAIYEFGGRYHYLHFASDYSVTEHGLSLSASYSFDEI